ncbi:MAG TPA: roadblock/LC7 domain-containing protein [Planctomycetota bacterium]|nr:roadblock/LC7 domain-containing protein [Planctomycetota bacterium]
MSSDADLKKVRMVYYAEDTEALEQVLDRLLDLSRAKRALLIDVEGHMVCSRGGGLDDLDIESVSALVAGTFAATKETARLLGQEEFSVLFHQGEKDSIQLTLMDDRLLLGIIFDDSTTIGMVRLYAKETARKVQEVLSRPHQETAGESDALGEGFGESVEQSLDNLFSE